MAWRICALPKCWGAAPSALTPACEIKKEDPEARAKHPTDDGLAYLHAAELFGARTVRIDAGVRADTFTDEQFDTIVKRYREYAQRAYDNGYQVGPENHWGAEVVPENMPHLQGGESSRLRHVAALPRQPGDASMAPWAMHTHISMEVVTNSLEQSMTMLRDAGYTGFWGVEHHSGQNEYAEVAIQVARVRDVLERWRAAGSAG